MDIFQLICHWATAGPLFSVQRPSDDYPLVNIQKAIEHGDLVRGFTQL